MLKDGLSSIIFDDEITVYWNRIDSLGEDDFYRVYLNGKPLTETKKTHFEFFDLIPETEYTVKVELCKDEAVLVGEESYKTKKSPVKIDVTKAPYSAVGDGSVLNTKALQKALDDCRAGEAVYFPAGTYLTGALNVHRTLLEPRSVDSISAIVISVTASAQQRLISSVYKPRRRGSV